ncbi:MAG: DUF3102 domain-containing protein [Oscillospiraceae bacterium]|nr:DUF3102 domain-containing protein [Oscillospiraceae bacterium]
MDCEYYSANARGELVIEDQEQLRRAREREREEKWYAEQLGDDDEEEASEIITVSARSVDTITAEIIGLANQTAQILLLSACEMGKRMLEAKELCAHGQWDGYLAGLCEQLGVSQRTARNWMKLSKEWNNQANLQSLANLTYTKAVKLLSLPEAEREEFVEAHDVEAMSSRELEQAIRAQRDAEAAAQALREQARAQQEQISELSRQVEAEKSLALDARTEAERLRNNPEIPAARIEAIAEEARKQAEAAYAEQLQTAQEEAAEKEEARAGMEAALVEAQRQLAELKAAPETQTQTLGDPDGAAFEIYLKELQETVNKMNGHYLKAKARNPELAARMVKAFRGLTDKLDGLTKKMEASA